MLIWMHHRSRMEVVLSLWIILKIWGTFVKYLGKQHFSCLLNVQMLNIPETSALHPVLSRGFLKLIRSPNPQLVLACSETSERGPTRLLFPVEMSIFPPGWTSGAVYWTHFYSGRSLDRIRSASVCFGLFTCWKATRYLLFHCRHGAFRVMSRAGGRA